LEILSPAELATAASPPKLPKPVSRRHASVTQGAATFRHANCCSAAKQNRRGSLGISVSEYLGELPQTAIKSVVFHVPWDRTSATALLARAALFSHSALCGGVRLTILDRRGGSRISGFSDGASPCWLAIRRR